MWLLARRLIVIALLGGLSSSAAQEPDAVKRKTATIQWVADLPQLTYDVRFAGGDSATMPTALKYLLKDLAELEGWYLTGEDKSKTIATQTKRISLEYTKVKSKPVASRVSKIDVKETPQAVEFVVTYAKKAHRDDVTRLGGVLKTFARKYAKVAKSVGSTVEHAETAKASVWTFEVRFKEAAKDKIKK